MDRKRRQIRYNNDLGAGVPNWWVMAPYGAKTHMGHRVVMIQNELGTTVWE